jgi:hypothetical protein
MQQDDLKAMWIYHECKINLFFIVILRIMSLTGHRVIERRL